ncbi:MAG TPA: MgtC/SapB family protein [Bacteroidota bacterium]|nr:MgtC/SapB family protein [Bacteroidota bacterium]
MESTSFFFTLLPTFLIRSSFAIICGACIGIERERKGKPAGFRTNTLICLGSTLYMLVADFALTQLGIMNTDPTRIASQVVTGIGFLGAGTIIQSRGEVIGLTSAATIWVVAGIGLLIGAGFPLFGILCTVLVLFTLVGLEKIEPKILGKCHFVRCEVIFADDGGRTRAEIVQILSDHSIEIAPSRLEKPGPNATLIAFTFCDKHPSHHRFMTELLRTPGVNEIKTGEI